VGEGKLSGVEEGDFGLRLRFFGFGRGERSRGRDWPGRGVGTLTSSQNSEEPEPSSDEWNDLGGWAEGMSQSLKRGESGGASDEDMVKNSRRLLASMGMQGTICRCFPP